MGKYTTIKQNITQVVLIVFSVVLGLYLSERIEERKNRQESQELLTTIKLEVKDNMNLVTKWAYYHQEIQQKLDNFSKEEEFIAAFINDKNILFEKLFTRGTLMDRTPANDAWDIAKTHPLIMNVEHDKLMILSKVYKQQEATFDSPTSKITDLFSSKDVNTKENAKANLKLMSDYFHELFARERTLMEYYREAEKTLDLFIKLSADELKNFSGNYWSEKDAYARKIYVKNDTLRYFRNENSESILMPISSNEFRMINVRSDVRIRFDDKETRTMTVIINAGEQTIFNEFQPIVYTSEELTDFEGRYYNKELDVFYSLKLENDLLILYINDIKKSLLKPMVKNIFSTDDNGTFKFTNDQESKLLGFQLVDGRGKSIKFEKK